MSLPLLGLGSQYVGQENTIQFVQSLICFQDFLFLLGWLFGQMESMDVACALQEAGDADSRAHTRSQVWVEYNIIPYTSTSITLPHLCQGHHGHCIVTSSDGGMGRLGGGSFILGFGWGDRGWVYFFYFLFCFCAAVNCSFMAGTW